MNRVASCGITLPLEVFWTGPQRGWGVRCAVSIPIGQFICEYVGAVATDEEAVRPIRTYVKSAMLCCDRSNGNRNGPSQVVDSSMDTV